MQWLKIAARQYVKEKEEKERRAREEARLEAERRETKRLADIQNAQIDEKLIYSENWSWSEGFWIFQTSGGYRMAVTCFIERKEGNRYQLRVGDVQLSDYQLYSTPTINGVKVNKGDIIWAKPLEGSKWVYGE